MNARTIPVDDRSHGARTVRAPRGTQRTAKSWLTEAPLRMLMNNLDPEVAENPDELVVYGGIGRAARNWECFDRIVETLRALERGRDAADPVRQAGRRVPHARGCAARAARQFESGAEVVDVGALQRARPPGPDDVRPDDCRLVDLHRQPGHRAGHARDVRRDGSAPLRRRSQGQVDSHRGPRRHGRRAAARGDDGRREHPVHRMPAEPHREAARHALPRRAGAVARCSAEDDRRRDRGTPRDLGRRARQRSRARARDGPARHPAGCGHRSDLRARSRQRLSADRLDRRAVAGDAHARSRRGHRGCAAFGRRARRRRCSTITRWACRRSTTATTSARSRTTKA